jgi:hypothetical protein
VTSVTEEFIITVNDVPSLLGDTNGDGKVDLVDLNNVRNFFGAAGPGVAGDTNGDNVVDLTDLNNVRNNFGASSGGAPSLSTLIAAPTVASGMESHSLSVNAAGTKLSVGGQPVLLARRITRPTHQLDAADLLFGSIGETSLLTSARKSRVRNK